MSVDCPVCGSSLTVGEQIGGKLTVAMAGALLGSRMNWEAAVAFAIVGVALGHILIDSDPRLITCPQCLAALRLTGAVLALA